MSLLKDAIDTLVNLGRGAVTHTVQPFPNDDEKRLVVGPNGVTTLETPLVEPDRIVECLRLCDFTVELGSFVDPEDHTPKTPAVHFDGEQVACYSDAPFNANGATLETAFHPQSITVLRMSTPQTIDQRALVRLLRHDLASAVDLSVLARFRTINWEGATRVKASYQHANQGLDAEVRTAVNQADMPPEQFVAEVKLFTLYELEDFRFGVTITVDIDAEKKLFTLTLLPGDADKLRIERLRLINEALERFLPGMTIVGAKV